MNKDPAWDPYRNEFEPCRFPWDRLILLCLCLSCGSCGGIETAGPGYPPPYPFQRGIHLATTMGAYSHPDAGETVRVLKGLNVEWIQMVPFAWQPDIQRPHLRFRDDSRTQTEFIRLVHEEGMRIMMKPHVWSHQFWGEGGQWRGGLRMESGEDWEIWFRKYEDFILHYARLSERTGVELLCIGLEYLEATKQRPEDWKRLIRKVRGIYSGPITYAANFQGEMEAIDFWKDLDYVGVILYPHLTEEMDPTLEELLRGWGPVKEKLKRMSERYGKPVLIAEVGFNSIRGAAREPWKWARPGSRLDLELQARCYQATFRALWKEPWLEGVYFWKWGIPQAGGGPEDIHYSPKGKPASEVLRYWYDRLERSGLPSGDSGAPGELP